MSTAFRQTALDERDAARTRGAAAPTATAPAPARAADGHLRRQELAAFLRSRRERIAPQQVGLPLGNRRRTPGLRREEVATLAGVGVTWYTWLEQGRDINVSQQVLDAVARTLLLDPHERAHLFTLAGTADDSAAAECQSLPPTVQVLLDRLDPYPACVRNPRYDILAYNYTCGHLFGDLDELPLGERNSLWLMFTDPARRTAIVDWDDTARRMVAEYRAAMAEHVAEPTWKCLVTRLTRASKEFTELWDRREVAAPENRTKRFLHPRAGLLSLDYTHLWLGQRLGTRMTTYTPADDETQARLSQLHQIRVSGTTAHANR
ncbi:MAG TPA: helix-turn-helix transcriptional regulator [Streptosporangiaceae bacterium]|nr:helix-turn-helix transcriptional regulator [Streptosporangiaceae bacterium]